MQSENSYSSQTPQSSLAFKLLYLWVNFFLGASLPLTIMVTFTLPIEGGIKGADFNLKNVV